MHSSAARKGSGAGLAAADFSARDDHLEAAGDAETVRIPASEQSQLLTTARRTPRSASRVSAGGASSSSAEAKRGEQDLDQRLDRRRVVQPGGELRGGSRTGDRPATQGPPRACGCHGSSRPRRMKAAATCPGGWGRSRPSSAAVRRGTGGSSVIRVPNASMVTTVIAPTIAGRTYGMPCSLWQVMTPAL